MALYPLSGMQRGETQVLEALPHFLCVAFVHNTNGYEGSRIAHIFQVDCGI